MAVCGWALLLCNAGSGHPLPHTLRPAPCPFRRHGCPTCHISLQVTYNPKETSYEQLLEIWLENHDPTTLNRQGGDTGSQYRQAAGVCWRLCLGMHYNLWLHVCFTSTLIAAVTACVPAIIHNLADICQGLHVDWAVLRRCQQSQDCLLSSFLGLCHEHWSMLPTLGLPFRSGIYTHTEEQKQIADNFLKQAQSKFKVSSAAEARQLQQELPARGALLRSSGQSAACRSPIVTVWMQM